MKHVNIPVFIPHLGCPNNCVFCNQRRISGFTSFNREDTEKIIKNALSTVDTKNTECEIAFFGGSFTGIPREDMLYLLEVARKFIISGDVKSIRLSTRPDYIDCEILDILKKYGVKNIELGLQSMSDKVLIASKRGHNSDIATESCRLIKEYGFTLVGQMMIGLPKSTLEDEIYTAEIIAKECDMARVYPTVIFRETELCDMAVKGEYKALELDDCIRRTGEVLSIFEKAGKKVIRIGLQSTDNLYDKSSVYGGDYHPAVGELAENYLYFKKICEKTDALNLETNGKSLIIQTAKGTISKVIGQRKINKEKLLKKYNFNSVKVVENCNLLGYNIMIDIL